MRAFAPAELKKDAGAFDLPIALGLLISTGQLQSVGAESVAVAGELALDGSLRPVRGALAMAMDAARRGIPRLIVPLQSAREAAVVKGVEVIGVVFESGEPREIQEFVTKNGIPYRQALGDDKMQDAYEANQGFPTTFVIDPQGTLLTKTIGSNPDKFARLQQTVDVALLGR